MSELRDFVDEYLAIRRRLGFKLDGAARLLRDFVVYHERTGAGTVTSEAILSWAKQPTTAQPIWWHIRLGVVRRFAQYLNGLDARHEVPPADVLPARQRRATPFLYSDDDIAGLMAAAGSLSNTHLATTYSTVIGLLAVTGMRIGEVIRLDRSDVDWSEGLLTVRSSKFGKSREVALLPSTIDALRTYDRQRRRVWPRPKTLAFFVSTVGTRLAYDAFHRAFHNSCRFPALQERSPRSRPRPHDLRHTFAVSTLLAWYQADLDVGERIHLLSTYLGHTDPANTYWYLSAAPELLALAGERLERALGEPA